MYLAENEYLYKDSEVEFADEQNLHPELSDLDDDLEDLSKLQPNKKLLGVYPFKLWLYNVGDTAIDIYIMENFGREKRILLFRFDTLVTKLKLWQYNSDFRKWLREKGEPPNLIDSNLIDETAVRMENYLYNRGYFYAEAAYTVDFNTKRKKARVNYLVELNTLYRMRKIYYEIDDPALLYYINNIPDSSLLETGVRFDVDYLRHERNRIANFLLTRGYFKFDKEYVYFEVDSSSETESLDIYVKVNHPPGDSIHRQYYINKIFVHTQTQLSDSVNQDTIRFEYRKKADSIESIYYIIRSEKMYSSKSISDQIFINDGDYYSITDWRKTIASFSNLGIFKYVTIQHQELDSGGYYRYLDLDIRLERLPTNTISYELNLSTTSDLLLGIGLNLSGIRNNTFRRMDKLRLNLGGGIDLQITEGEVFINTSEFTAGIGFEFPKFFWPFYISVPKRYYPKTNTEVEFKYVSRNDPVDVYNYILYSTSFEYGTEWLEGSRKKTHSLYPVDISLVLLPYKSPEFDSLLQRNPLLLQSFEPQFILAPNYTWLYNSQALIDRRYDNYFRWQTEFAGHLFQAVNALLHNGDFNTSDHPYELFGYPYSNYTRTDADFRNYFNIYKTTELVSRTMLGISFPYWNSVVNPYVKQFFSGGANGIRAFRLRKLGPGSYFNYFVEEGEVLELKPEDQSGDIKFEINLEYRFPLVNVLKGAVFCDIGNIWTLKDDPKRPGGQFQFRDFYRELAVGPGAGLRLDFVYIVIRVDAAYPLFDPALDSPAGKALKNDPDYEGVLFPEKSFVWNFAIGYPF